MKLGVGVLNLDGSNRRDSVQDAETLRSTVSEIVKTTFRRPSLLSMSEVSNHQKWIEAFENDPSTTYMGVFVAEAKLYAAYDIEVFSLEKIVVSLLGHTLGLLLKEVAAPHRTVLHLTVHCPKQKPDRWEHTIKALLRLCHDYRRADLIVIAGDFNAKPEKLIERIPTYEPAIDKSSSENATTRRGNCIDNVMISKGEFSELFIDQQNPHFGHCPLMATFSLFEEDNEQ